MFFLPRSLRHIAVFFKLIMSALLVLMFLLQARREAEAEEAALVKFQRAQERMAQKDSTAHQQAAKKGAGQVVNAFNALALDESDDENSS
jgi:hypothetical protein